MKKSKILFLLTLLLLTLTLFDNYSSKAATGDENIYSIPSSVKNDWNKVWGGKSFSMTSGKDLVYDIYDNKYMEDGYTITTRDFGKGEQKYLRFRGWAVLFGYKKHTPTNQDTFIVAHKVSGSGIGTQKIYKAVQKGLNATEDLEFNNQGSGVWNECPASATNKRNDECNMRYEDTSFDAYLPLDELFKNKYEKASWKLVLVKKVSSNIVYTPLIFPFEFDDRNYNGGKISLSSGFNAKTLRMNSEQVLRRSKPRESASSVTDDLGSDRYFTQNQDYTNVDSDESQTAVWYGVRSPKDKNKTKWAATSYWTFRGDQGSLSYEPPNRPPVAEFSTSPSKIYNDTTITFNNTSSDPDKDKLTYKWQIKPQGTSDSNYTTFSTSKSPTKKLAKGNYTVQLTVSDGKATNSVKHAVIVSNRPPVAAFNTTPTSDIYYNTKITFNNTSSDPDKDKLTYKWEIKPRYTADSEYTTFSTSLTPTKILPKGEYTVQLTVSDGVDSNSYKRAVIVNNSPPVAAFTYSPTTVYNDTTVTFTNGSSDPDKDKLTYKWEYQEPNSTAWTQFSTTTSPTKVLNKKGDWNIRLTANDGEASTSITKKITVGNRPPVAAFTYSPTTVYNDTTVTFTNGSSDPDKDKLTYKWEYQEPNSTAWTQFSTTTSPTKVLNKKGDWNIRLTVNDGTTSTSITKKITVGNRPPVAAFTYSPTTVYNDTTVTFTNGSSDPDKDKLTYQWEYQEPNSTTWTQFSTTTSPTKVLNKKGDWNIRLTVNDGTTSTSVTKKITVGNRPPVAAFTYSPTTVYNDTKVTFTNGSSDPDKDKLTYQWEYQEPNSTAWTQFSTGVSPTKVLNKKGDWNIRLTVNDGTTSTSITKKITVENRTPSVTLSYAPNPLYEGDNVTLTATVIDPDKDKLTVIIEENINGQWKQLKQQNNVVSGGNVIHSMTVSYRDYSIRARAIDPDNATGTATLSFSVNPLKIDGFVKHTPKWEEIHNQKKHPTSYFYSGEKFVLSANVTDHPIEYVIVNFKGIQKNGVELNINQALSGNNPIYNGEIFDTKMSEPTTSLENGNAYFLFTAKWKNGTIKQDLVTIQIIDNVYGVFDFYRSN